MGTSDLRDQLQLVLGDAYRIERELPPGGMSRLFLATERSLDRQVVIKLLPPEYASEVSAARFQREVTLTAHLQHPHILPILSAGSRDGLLYYVMPYVEGSHSGSGSSETEAPGVRAVQILREVADALARAHKAGSCTGTSSLRTFSCRTTMRFWRISGWREHSMKPPAASD